MIHELIVIEHLYGQLEVEAPNKSKALELGQQMSDDGLVSWKNTYEKLGFAEDEIPEFSPDYVLKMAREHTHFRKGLIDLNAIIDQEVSRRPNVMASSNDPKADHTALVALIGNTQKIRSAKLEEDYEPRYDQISELIELLEVLVEYNSSEKAHYDKCGEQDKANHIYNYVRKAKEFINKLNSDKGEFLLLETAGGAAYVQTVKDTDGKPRCFTSHSEAVDHGKSLQAPKVIRIR